MKIEFNMADLRSIKVTVDLQSAFRKMLCLRAALTETMVNYNLYHWKANKL